MSENKMKITREQVSGPAHPIGSAEGQAEAKIRELEAELANLRGEKEQAAAQPKDYVLPTATEEQLERNTRDAWTRVVKTTPRRESRRFWIQGGQKTVVIGQHRVPRADDEWDVDRLIAELRREGQMLLDEAFPDIPHYCEANNCWNQATLDGAFCSVQHRDGVLNAHDVRLKFN